MTKKTGALIALAIVLPMIAAAQTPAQAQRYQVCSPGMEFVPAHRGGAGNSVAGYCVAAPSWGTYDPYTGGDAQNPNASDMNGPGQIIPRTR